MGKIVLFLLFFTSSLFVVGQMKAEKQNSFAREVKPLSYYVKQAELWALELEKDSLSEENWYNYFRACRNAHGTSDWRSDFIKESPYLKEGGDIVKLMEKYIPNTFTYYYLSYMTNGVGTSNYENLLKAYEMNPNFEGIHSSMISYAESSINWDFRKKINKEWYQTNYLSPQLLNYNYNVLMSVDSSAIILTQHDNDTYPAWMLQDALGIRSDVTVINIDFLLFEEYRKGILKYLNIKDLELGEINIDDYHGNWQKVVKHILNNYTGDRPVYLGLTLSNYLYKDYEEQLFVSGLTFKYSKTKLDLTKLNRDLYENYFLLDYLENFFIIDANQANVNYQNLNYIRSFKIVYDIYKSENRIKEANKIKELFINLAKRINNEEYLNKVLELFNN